EGGVAETVIGRALLRVLQRLVGFVDFLELVLAGMIAGVAVGMELHGELAESALELLLVGALLHAQRFVEISFHLFPQSGCSTSWPSIASFAGTSFRFRCDVPWMPAPAWV